MNRLRLGLLLSQIVLLAFSFRSVWARNDVLLDVQPGYGTERTLYLRGRAYRLHEKAAELAEKIPVPKMKRAVETVVRFFPVAEGDESMKVTAGGVKESAKTDEEGCFEAAIGSPPGKEWSGCVRVKIDAGGKEDFMGTVFVPDPASKLGIISDVDDTIKLTEVRDKSKVVKDILMGDASTVPAVPGMASLFRDLSRGPGGVERPVHYVSASPDILSSRLERFLSLNEFPPGSLDLIQLGSPKSFFKRPPSASEHKTRAIGRILDTYPGRRYVLFGDGAQKDPAVYSRLSAAYPGRIEAIYIRRTKKASGREKRHPLCFFFTSPEEVREDCERRHSIGGAGT